MEDDDSDDGEPATPPQTPVTKRPARPTPVPPTKKGPPPPPICLHDIHDHKMLVKLVNSVAVTTYTIKYTRDATNIMINNKAERQSLIEKLKAFKINFYTYTDKLEKRHPTSSRDSQRHVVAEILAELENNHKITPTRCVAMKTRGAPMYLVTLPTTVTRQQLSEVESIDGTMIRWEKYYTSKRITQCHRCQSWGHATSNCFASPKCLKCADSHFTHECKKPKDVSAKCTNYGGDHPASATSCVMFERRNNWIDERAAQRRPANKPQHAPKEADFPPLRTFAAAPAVNPWGRPAQTTSGSIPRPAPARPTATPATAATAAPSQNQLAAFKELGEEMRKLNSLINMQEVVRQIKTLNTMLQAAQPEDRMMIAVQFFTRGNY